MATILHSIQSQLPFITSTGPPLDNLLPGYIKANVPSLPPYAVFTKEIVKSPNDDRLYRLILLENGMEVLLISDPTTDKASASMDVRVGHLSDPEDLQGLAHFCEHLMFMGTEKYPKENDYTEFLTQNSGSSNAFTGMDQTCYYFDVHPTAFEGALDRFAQFFIAPVFDPSCTEREANAVHSENSKNLQSDMWRFFQLDKSTSSKDHVYWRFGTGNKQTLWDEPRELGFDVRERLMQWQEKYYSANLMKLVVLGKDSLDELTKEVVAKFSPALNRHLSVPIFAGSPLGKEQLQTALVAKSVKDQRLLELSFPLPDESVFWATKPIGFLSHFIGHEGPGSVLSWLKAKGWANGMSAGAGNGATGFEFFKIQIDLTQEGLEHREEVISAIFSYIDLLKSTEPQKWAFTEVSQLSSLAFRFKEKGPPTQTAMGLSLSMSKPYPRDLLLAAPYIVNEWKPEVIKAVSELLSPKNCRMLIASQKGIDGVEYELKEKWYGTEYSVVPMSEKLLTRRASATTVEYPDLALPRPNSFIPTNLEIQNKVVVDVPAKRPLSLRNTPISRLWYKKDDRWWVPRAGVFILIRNPIIDDTPAHSIASRFFTELVKDALVEYSYDADLAGLSYTFDSQADGIVLSIDGYNDKLPVLAKVVVEKMKSYVVDEKRFEIVKDQLTRAYLNYRLEQPYNHVAFTVGHLTQETLWTHAERLAAIETITVENLQEYIGALLSRMHIETLVHGNMLKDEAINLVKMVETTFDPSPLTPQELLSHRALIVPEGKFLTVAQVGNPENVNSAVEQFTYVGDITDDSLRTKLAVFGTMVQEPLFDQLRAREQLGYIVSSGPRKSIGFIGLRVVVQSEKDSAYVETRIDQFWENYKTVLDNMSEEEIEKYKTTVINSKLEDHKTMWQESSHYWLNIHAGYYAFQQHEQDAKLIKEITKADLIEFYNTYFFDKPSHKIRRLSAHVRSHRIQPEALAALGPAIIEAGVPVDATLLAAFAESKPTIEVVRKFTSEYLTKNGKTPEEVDAFLVKVDALAAPAPVPEDVNAIEDINAFRKEEVPAPHSIPAKEYSDLFPAKL